MTETSFPRVNQPLGEDQWKSIGFGFGQGVIDRGGRPYYLSARDSVNNTVTISVDQLTGFSEAILQGFVHRITEDKVIPVPAVTSDTTYEIGLVYDPLKHDTQEGPITLTAWTSPANTEGGKVYMVLYRILRKNNVTLADSEVQENRQRIVTNIAVSKTSDLPTPTSALVDTMCFVRVTQQWWRCSVDENLGTVSWSEVGANIPAVSLPPDAETIPLRTATGSLRATVGPHSHDVINREYFNDNTTLLRTATGSATYGTIPLRSPNDGGFLVIPPLHNRHPATKEYVDNKNWSGNDITSGTVPWERISGSTRAYTETTGDATRATIWVDRHGKFFRYTSALKYKTDIKPWDVSLTDLLAMEPVEYTDKESGERRIGIVADSHADGPLDFLVQKKDGEVEGWHYILMPVAQQIILRKLAEKIEAQDAEIEELHSVVAENDQALSEMRTQLDSVLERLARLEGN